VAAVLNTATSVVAGSSGCSASTGKGSARFAKFQVAPKSQGLDVGYVAKITINTESSSEFRAQDADVRAKSPARAFGEHARSDLAARHALATRSRLKRSPWRHSQTPC
jgi:hypothetical protein